MRCFVYSMFLLPLLAGGVAAEPQKLNDGELAAVTAGALVNVPININVNVQAAIATALAGSIGGNANAGGTSTNINISALFTRLNF